MGHRDLSPSLLTVCSIAWLASGCSEVEPGLSLKIALRSTWDGASPALIATRDGGVAEIERASLNVSAVELVPCPSGSAWLRPAIDGILVSRALAHSGSSPTRLGDPSVMDLRVPEARSMGELAPLPHTYCSVRVELGPSDDDAQGLPDADFVGATLRFAARPASGEGEAIVYRSDATVTAEATLSPALTLDGDRKSAALTVHLGGAGTPPSWPNASLEGPSRERAAFDALLDLSASAEVSIDALP